MLPQIRSTLLETIKQAFAFYDEDDSNSIETADLINILRAMGHEPTRKERRALLRDADADRNGVIQVGVENHLSEGYVYDPNSVKSRMGDPQMSLRSFTSSLPEMNLTVVYLRVFIG